MHTHHRHHTSCGCQTRRNLLTRGLASIGALGAVGGVSGVLSGCAENGLGRDTLSIVSDSQMEAAAAQAWAQLKATAPISRSASANSVVREVGGRIVGVSGVGGTPEFIVIEDDSPNAFVLPGARVAVHTGMFSVASTRDMLAAVLGHEIAHVTLKHANERASQQGLANIVIGAVTGGGEKENLAKILGIGATVGVLLPYGRTQELESDRLGVRYSHRAGFDPRAALTLWDRMAALGGSRPPELLSTHPGPVNRKEVIAAEIAALG